MKRRSLEIALLAFGAAFLALVAISFRPGSRPRRGGAASTEVPAPRDAGPATSVSSGFDFTESLKGKPLFRIKAEKTAGFGAAAVAGASPELYAGENVALTLYPEDGEPVTVHAERAEYDARTRSATLEGNVRWADARGSLAETGKVIFGSADRALAIPGALHFSRGGFDVEARSGRYDVATRTLALAGPVEGSGSAKGAAFSKLRADAALYRKDEGAVELSGRVHAESGEGDTIESERLTLKLAEPEGRLAWARADGRVRGVVGASRFPKGGKRPGPYSGEQAAFFFGDDGQLKTLALSGSPASAEQAERKVTAREIALDFAGRRVAAARARGEVAVVSGAERASADRGELSFGEDGTVQGLTLSGNARLEGEGRSGRADRATEAAGGSVWILTGNPRSSATVEQRGSRVSAPRIEIDDRNKIVRAEGGGVRAVLASAGEKRADAALLGDPSRPTYGKADRMAFDETGKTATLSGGAALWQDASSLFGRDITLNDSERSVVAVGQVRAVLAPDPSAVRPEEKRPTVLTASRLTYREAPESASGRGANVALDGGVTAARGPWRASGRTGSALLRKDRRVEKLEFSGDVALSDSATGRRGQAEHAVDFPAEGRTILEGTPARVTDREGNRVAGATLTITDRGRRVEVTAPEGGKTETIHQTRRDR